MGIAISRRLLMMLLEPWMNTQTREMGAKIHSILSHFIINWDPQIAKPRVSESGPKNHPSVNQIWMTFSEQILPIIFATLFAKRATFGGHKGNEYDQPSRLLYSL
jgi:hypothetical protein